MNIFISNLSFRIDNTDLKQLFQEYGEVISAKVMTDRETGRSRGFGFVEMSDDAAAQKAINELDKAEYDGRVINVNEAKPREERPQGERRFDNRRPQGGGRGPQDRSKRWE